LINEIPSGFCQCGCGKKTRIAVRSAACYGWVNGQPMRYVIGHRSNRDSPRGSRNPRKPLRVIGPSIAYIPLTQDKLALVDADDADRLARWNWCAHWSPENKCFYAIRGLHKTDAIGTPRHMAYEIIDVRAGYVPDHQNGNTLNYMRINLREATYTENRVNCSMRTDNSTGFRGIFPRQKIGPTTYRAAITYRGVRTNLGEYSSAEEASEVYEEKAKQLFGEFYRAPEKRGKQ
jgi:hypothetical protein